MTEPARTTPDSPATSSDGADRCCVCGGGHVVYRNYREQPFCRRCANCGCNQDVCVRTGINDPAVSGDAELQQQIAEAIEADAERPRDQRVGIINAVMAVRDEEMQRLRDDARRLGLMVDEYGAGARTLSEKLGEARATNQRLNLRAQQLESELAAYRHAVAQWEISDGRTYVPLRTLAVIAKAAGRNIETPQWLQHYQRVEQAETAIGRVRKVLAFAERVVETSGPGPAGAVRSVIARLHAAVNEPAPDQPAAHDGGPSVAECAEDDRTWPLEKTGE